MRILAASKNRKISEIKKAHQEGILLFGENYVQEAFNKIQTYKELKIELHLIGKLQKSKINKALDIFDCIQTIDSAELAKEINKRNKPIKIMIQVNLTEEPQKNGCLIENLNNLVKECKKLTNLNLIGLMFIGKEKNNMNYFKTMKKLQIKYKLKELSMGMSNDYENAIKAGSTIIRLGKALFDSKF